MIADFTYDFYVRELSKAKNSGFVFEFFDGFKKPIAPIKKRMTKIAMKDSIKLYLSSFPTILGP